MDVYRAKVAATGKQLTEEDQNFLEGISEGVEKAFLEEATQRNKLINELAARVGVIPEGETVSETIRKIAVKVDENEAKSKRTLTGDEKCQLKRMLTEKKDEIMRARQDGINWAIEFKAKRTASALMTTATVLTGASANNTLSIMDDFDNIFEP